MSQCRTGRSREYDLPSLLGGAGSRAGGMESTYIAGLASLGVPEDVALGGTLLYRLYTGVLSSCLGLGVTRMVSAT
jgi:uncharacterized membrane protein YbhN (UPF0104 family)